ncbi:MAG: type II toxin-antitoxin system prevent-host-death family antitoxin [Caulobacteraceae bacterium]
MNQVSLAEAKAHLSELVERVIAGDTVCITRRGKRVAQLTAIEKAPAPIDFAAIRALRSTMPFDPEGAGDFVRRMRDEDRY